MRQPNIEKIEIVEPPIGELTKRHGSFTQGCFMGCFFLILVIGGILLCVKFYLGSTPGMIKSIPANFPTSVPVYDRDNIEKITLIPGKYKSRSLQLASIAPRLLLSPLMSNNDEPTSSLTNGSPKVDKLQQTWQILMAPVDSDDRDTVRIEWINNSATPAFITGYYSNELTKAGYTIIHSDNASSFSFSNDTVSGSLQILSGNSQSGDTSYLLLIVNYPASP